MDYLPISSLNEFAYCPKNAWLMLAEGAWEDTADTVAGRLLHERADSSTRSVVGGVTQIRTVYLYSDRYGLTGIADLVEETADAGVSGGCCGGGEPESSATAQPVGFASGVPHGRSLDLLTQ